MLQWLSDIEDCEGVSPVGEKCLQTEGTEFSKSLSWDHVSLPKGKPYSNSTDFQWKHLNCTVTVQARGQTVCCSYISAVLEGIAAVTWHYLKDT